MQRRFLLKLTAFGVGLFLPDWRSARLGLRRGWVLHDTDS